MKKIFMFLAAACAVVACDPLQEDISNDGPITLAQLKEKTVVSVDKTSDGKNGNQITCETFAPVNAKWSIGDPNQQNCKAFKSNYAYKKMKLGEHMVYLDALCADGTLLQDSFPITCEVITNPLEKFYIYGDPEKGQEPLVLNGGDAAAGRFSDNEGKGLPFLSDDIYWGFKTLVFEILEAKEGDFIWADPPGSISGPAQLRVMNGWWSATYADGVQVQPGLWELPITKEIATDCAQGGGGSGKDLDLLVTQGSITIGSVYYEE